VSITKPKTVVEFKKSDGGYTAHVSITMDAVSENRDDLREEVMDTLRHHLRGDHHYDVTLVIPEFDEVTQ
jgi:hypothetical protein